VSGFGRLFAFFLFSISTLGLGAPDSTEVEDVIHVGFSEAEADVIGLFKKDLHHLEGLTPKTALFEVTAAGTMLPDNYSTSFRSKLERLIVGAKNLRLLDCPQCQVSRLVKDGEGKLHYEAVSEEPGRAAKVAKELGVDDLLYAHIDYSPGELR
jgi:hypothetical protein